jgi:hypothetical protein
VFKRWVTAEVIPSIRRTGKYDSQGRTQYLLGLVMAGLRGRGAAKDRQLNKFVAHRDGTVSFRIGRHWVRNVQPLHATTYPMAHSIREGLVLLELDRERKALIQ